MLVLGREQLRNRNIVTVAGGRIKVRAIKSILNTRLLSGLITDESTARALLPAAS